MYSEDAETTDVERADQPAWRGLPWWGWLLFAITLTTLSVITGVRLAQQQAESAIERTAPVQAAEEEERRTDREYPSHLRDRVYATPGDVPLTFDVIRRPGPELRPAVVLLHGGGWWSGRKEDFQRDAPTLTRDLVGRGFAVVPANYRLACSTPERRRSAYGLTFGTGGGPMCGAFLADQLEDVRTLVAFLRDNAHELGIDRDRIAILGVSAGGHLAMLTAASLPLGEGVQAIVNWSGPPTVEFITRQDARPSDRHARTILASFTNAVGCAAKVCPEKWRAASPIRALAARGEHDTAVFSLAGQRETQVPPVEVSAFHAALTRLGFPNAWHSGAGLCHGRTCGLMPLDGSGTTGMQASIDFLGATIGDGAAESGP